MKKLKTKILKILQDYIKYIFSFIFDNEINGIETEDINEYDEENEILKKY